MSVLAGALVALALVAVVYWVLAAACAAAFARRAPAASAFTPPVTVLKPLRGEHPLLYEALRSVCEQDYPAGVQIVFGVGEADDPAAHVVRRLMTEFPALDLALVTDAPPAGANPKVANVAHMYKSARHDVLVLADSDVRVGRDYLRRVVTPLADPQIGLVTCLYRATPVPGLPSALGAMYVNDWFFPAALVAERLGPLAYAFGATVVSRRDVVDELGGIISIGDYLADDYMLGYLVARSGRRVVLSDYVVETIAGERTWRALIQHELRWARTIRSVRPGGYLMSVVTFGVPLSLLAVVAGGVTRVAVAALVANLVVRVLGRRVCLRAAGAAPRAVDAWLVPVRDVLSLGVWLASFCGRTVRWYGKVFTVDRNSYLRRPRP